MSASPSASIETMASPFIVALVMGRAVGPLANLNGEVGALGDRVGERNGAVQVESVLWPPFPGGAPGHKVIRAGFENCRQP